MYKNDTNIQFISIYLTYTYKRVNGSFVTVSSFGRENEKSTYLLLILRY